MSHYSVTELREKLPVKLVNLGFDKKTLENPSFASVIRQIDSLISQMNMLNDSDVVVVTDEDKKISFAYRDTTGTKYSLVIACSDPQKLNCIRIKESTDPYGRGEEKEIIKREVNVDKFGGIECNTYATHFDNYKERKEKTRGYTMRLSAKQVKYTEDGIMIYQDSKSFGEIYDKYFDMDSLNPKAMASQLPSDAFNPNDSMFNRYNERTVYSRDNIDTAKAIYEDKSTRSYYYGPVPLIADRNGSYQNMNVEGFPKSIKIASLNEYDIKKIINNENNKKIKDGLAKIAKPRNELVGPYECKGMEELSKGTINETKR